MVKRILTIGCWTFYHYLHLQCQDALTQQNDGLVTDAEGLPSCNNMGETVLGWEMLEGEPQPAELYQGK